MSHNYAGNLNEEKQISTGKNDALISTGDIASQIGVQCDQIPALIGVAIEDECKNTPVSGFSSLTKYIDECERSVVKASTVRNSSVSAVMPSHSSKLSLNRVFIGHCCNYLLKHFVTLNNLVSANVCELPIELRLYRFIVTLRIISEFSLSMRS